MEFLIGILMFGVVLCPYEPLALQVCKAPSTKVILLPNADGTVGKVLVSSDGGAQEVGTAYGAVAVGEGGRLSPYNESAASVQAKFGRLLAARPQPPRSFMLYFKAGSNDLEEASLSTLDDLKQDAQERTAPEIRVIGHTDTVGSEADNDALSQARAEAIANQLNNWGVVAASIEAVGRGERALLVKTADNVDEPKNRRVEVSIR